MAAELSITPQDALIDVPRRVAVSGLEAGEVLTVTSRTVRGPGVAWHASARFAADANGVVDLARDAPLPSGVAGSYSGVSAMGLIWSQVPEPAADQAPAGSRREVFAAAPGAALVTQVNVARGEAVAGAAPLQADFTQHLAGPGVTRREVREDGLVGTLYLPAGPGPHPCVIVLNGSGGGINEPRAALYASHGYAALALAYFKAPGLSDYISNTRLEYFETALAWVHRTLKPAHGFVALSGQSRGGELVLLLATLFPESVSAVVAYVPGAVVHCAQNACDPALGREGPAWLFRGRPLVDVWQDNRTASWAPWDSGPEPRRHTHAILTALDDADAVARARIAVEKIRGPVML
ncbi:MAG: palmitoyl-CoA hydrolase, partial [Ramlibacter sp.]|nr:palmitoyl-CoA hydrolase [Ramlibacter sp.]